MGPGAAVGSASASCTRLAGGRAALADGPLARPASRPGCRDAVAAPEDLHRAGDHARELRHLGVVYHPDQVPVRLQLRHPRGALRRRRGRVGRGHRRGLDLGADSSLGLAATPPAMRIGRQPLLRGRGDADHGPVRAHGCDGPVGGVGDLLIREAEPVEVRVGVEPVRVLGQRLRRRSQGRPVGRHVPGDPVVLPVFRDGFAGDPGAYRDLGVRQRAQQVAERRELRAAQRGPLLRGDRLLWRDGDLGRPHPRSPAERAVRRDAVLRAERHDGADLDASARRDLPVAQLAHVGAMGVQQGRLCLPHGAGRGDARLSHHARPMPEPVVRRDPVVAPVQADGGANDARLLRDDVVGDGAHLGAEGIQDARSRPPLSASSLRQRRGRRHRPGARRSLGSHRGGGRRLRCHRGPMRDLLRVSLRVDAAAGVVANTVREIHAEMGVEACVFRGRAAKRGTVGLG